MSLLWRRPVNNHAKAVAAEFLRTEFPRPSINFRPLVDLVDWALDQGWTPKQVADALPMCRSFTRNALEFVLRSDLVISRTVSMAQPASPARVCPVERCGGSGWVDTGDGTTVERCSCWSLQGASD